jgi:hypothetical protein
MARFRPETQRQKLSIAVVKQLNRNVSAANVLEVLGMQRLSSGLMIWPRNVSKNNFREGDFPEGVDANSESCYLAPMSDSDDDLLRQLEKSARPLTEVASYSRRPGIYGFFLLTGRLCIGRETLTTGNGALLYIGKTESSQQKRDVGEHLADGQTGRSTLRRSFGSLLREELNLRPQPRSDTEKSTRRFTNFKFDTAGEERLTAWMKNHLGLGFCELPDLTIPELKTREKRLIRSAKPPLNIDSNSESPYLAALKSAREQCAALAREWA